MGNAQKNMVVEKMEEQKSSSATNYKLSSSLYSPYIGDSKATRINNPFINSKPEKRYNPFTDNEAANKKFEQTLAECKAIKEANLYQTMVPSKPFHADKYNEKSSKNNDIMDHGDRRCNLKLN